MPRGIRVNLAPESASSVIQPVAPDAFSVKSKKASKKSVDAPKSKSKKSSGRGITIESSGIIGVDITPENIANYAVLAGNSDQVLTMYSTQYRQLVGRYQLTEDDELKLKKSLKASYLTLKKIKRKTLSFYIGVKDFIFEYGFYDVSNMIVYKTGKFKVTSKYFKNLPRHKCFKNIRSSLRGANLTSMKILHKIKEDLKDMWPDSDGVIKVVEDQKVRKSFSKKLFSLGSLDENKLAKSAEKFSQKYKWSKYIFNYVVIGKKMVHFYFAIQNKSVLKIDINI